jgi:hypothetical protein
LTVFFFWWDWGLNSELWACKAGKHTFSPFCCGYSGDGVLWTICLDWPWTEIFQISVSQVARIISMSLAGFDFLKIVFLHSDIVSKIFFYS